ncbi:hypothetical protein, partial [Psychrobacter sp. APC 3350]|uniref:hypothetical protein n=1 Tax=Psychrobacter sp. APC 3350 TaxID=3035195 RepID=UPI0025B50D13
ILTMVMSDDSILFRTPPKGKMLKNIEYDSILPVFNSDGVSIDYIIMQKDMKTEWYTKELEKMNSEENTDNVVDAF